jgi:hypothetical protein
MDQQFGGKLFREVRWRQMKLSLFDITSPITSCPLSKVATDRNKFLPNLEYEMKVKILKVS